MRDSLPSFPIPIFGQGDHQIWTLTSNGDFSIASLWEKLRTHFQWSHLVWFPAHIPKCSVITWLAILNRLSTKDRLVIFGIKTSSYCSLCTGSESHDHLFFNCPILVVVQTICLNVHGRLLSLDKLPQGSQLNWFVSEWNLAVPKMMHLYLWRIGFYELLWLYFQVDNVQCMGFSEIIERRS